MKKEIKVFVIFLLISGIISCILGVDRSWDLYSYHYYNAFAALHNRIGVDMMPAGIQSYLNPVLDVVDYFIINVFRYNKYLVTFLFGFPYGCFTYLLYLINRKIFDKVSDDDKVKKVLTIFATVIGGTECFVFSEIGTAY